VRGRAPFVVGGPQLKRKEEEPFVGVDLDPPGSSKEKKKEASICIIAFLSRLIFEKQKRNNIAPLDLFRRVAPLQRHQISDLEGASGLRPLA
jgi:hypothetical protein